MMKTRVLYLTPFKSPFMSVEEKILRSKYQVTKYAMNQGSSFGTLIIAYIRLSWNLLFLIPRTDLVVTWFADYHSAVLSLFTKLFRRKLIIFVGGYDCTLYPALNRGAYLNPFRGKCTAFALSHCDLIMVNHAALVKSLNTYYLPEGHKDGYLYYTPAIHTKYRLIRNGYDASILKRDPATTKQQNLIMCVGITPHWEDVSNKGFDLLIDIAKRNPQWDFILIGIKQAWINRLERSDKISSYKNICILPLCPQKELFAWYSKAQVYVQCSISEGMPNALGEAMLHECIPVGSNVAGIPSQIGSYGVLVMHRDSYELEEAIRKAFTMHTGEAAREYISKYYALAIRQETFLAACDSLLSPKIN